MSVYIEGMNMPKPGQIVLVEIDENGDVFAAYDGGRTKLADYKAVRVLPHGRLGDLDELHKEAVRRSEKAGTHDIWYNCTDRVICALDIKNAPTIIPAEEGET